MFFAVFAVLGLGVFSTVTAFRRINVERGNNFEALDVTDLVFAVRMFGSNSFASPLRILETFEPAFLEVQSHQAEFCRTSRGKRLKLTLREKQDLARSLLQLKDAVNKHMRFDLLEKVMKWFLFVVNYCVLGETFSFYLKKSRINCLDEALKRWRFELLLGERELRIKPHVSKNLGQVYLAVVAVRPLEKQLTALSKEGTVDLDFQDYLIGPGRQGSRAPRMRGPFPQLFPNGFALLDRRTAIDRGASRMDFEAPFPLEFVLGGDFHFLSPLKLQLSDPQFEVFFKHLKRIVLPNLSRPNASPQESQPRRRPGTAVRPGLSAHESALCDAPEQRSDRKASAAAAKTGNVLRRGQRVALRVRF